MAIEEGTETVPEREVSTSRRTKLVIIFTEVGETPRVEAHRERVRRYVDSGEIVNKTPVDLVAFSLANVQDDTITLRDGTKLTGAQMSEAISRWIDAKDQEQIEAAAVAADAEAKRQAEATEAASFADPAPVG